MNLTGVYNHFHKYSQPGDYIVIEDTNPKYNAEIEQGFSEEVTECGMGKMNAVRKVFEELGDAYMVDTYYCDMFK